MNTADRPGPDSPLVFFLSIALILTAAQPSEADGVVQGTVRRLTPEQMNRIRDVVKPLRTKALKMFAQGRSGEAIPVVLEMLSEQRAIALEASLNPVERLDEIKRRAEHEAEIGRMVQAPFSSFAIRDNRPEVGSLQFEILGTLELLGRLHESRDDFAAALATTKEIADLAAGLWGPGDWRTSGWRLDVERLARLAGGDAGVLKVVSDGKRATALVANSRTALGSAFCIDPNGLFLTSAQFTSGQSASVQTRFNYARQGMMGLESTETTQGVRQLPMSVILNLGTPDARTLPARVLRSDRTLGLALLKVETDRPLPSFEIDSGREVAADSAVTAFGLPAIAKAENGEQSDTPIVRPIPTRVASVRKQRGKPWIASLDLTPPAGYMGGPVLDESGRVVGMIVTGLPSTGVHYVIPSAKISEFIGPVLAVPSAPRLTYDARKGPVDWSVRLFSRSSIAPSTTVEILAGRSKRPFPARATAEGTFVARVVPVEADEPDLVELTFETKAGPASEVVDDRVVTVGGAKVRLGELRRLEFGPGPRAFTVDGRRLSGPFGGLEGLQARRPGGEAIAPAQADAIMVRCPPEKLDPIEAEVVVKEAGRVLDRQEFRAEVRERPAWVEGTLDPVMVGPSGSAQAIRPPPIEPPTAAVGKEHRPTIRPQQVSLNNVHAYSLAISHDGQRYASGGDGNRISMYDAETGNFERLFVQNSWVQSIHFTPDGRRLLSSAYQKRMHLWDVGNGIEVGRFEDQSEKGLEQSVLSPDGLLALSIYEGVRLILWDLESGKKLRTLAESSTPYGFAFTRDSRLVLVASPGEAGVDLRLVDARGGQVAWEVRVASGAARLARCLVSTDSKAVVVLADGTVERRDLADGSAKLTPLKLPDVRPGCAELSADGRLLLTGHDDKTVRYWNLGTGQERRKFPLPAIPTGAPAISPDGRFAVGHSFRRDLHVWSLVEASGAEMAAERRPSGAIQAVVIGGGGRYLLLVLKDARRLAVFDANIGEIVKELELFSRDVLVAAGSEKGFLAYPGLKVLHRLDLATLEVDGIAALPFDGKLKSIAMGTDSRGPLLASWSYSPDRDFVTQPVVSFIDPVTLKLVTIKGSKGTPKRSVSTIDALELQVGQPSSMTDPPTFRASAGGNFFASWNASTMIGIEFVDGKVRSRPLTMPGDAVPGFDGRSMFISQGLVGLDLPPGPATHGRWTIPSADPAYYLAVEYRPGQQWMQAIPTVRVYSASSNRPLFSINELAEMVGTAGVVNSAPEIRDHDRYQLIPAAKLLVTIPAKNDRLVLRRLDVAESLERLVVDELVVTSTPLVRADAGVPFRHRVETRSRGGEPAFELVEGPEGMTVSDRGELAWDVPVGFAGGEVLAKVRVEDAPDRAIVHSVRILIR